MSVSPPTDKVYYPFSYDIDTSSGDVFNIKFNNVYVPDFTTTAFTPEATAFAAFLTGQNCKGAVDNFTVTSIAEAAEAPVVDNGAGATEVSGSAATLNGVLISGGPAYVTIFYGKDPQNWSNTNLVGLVDDGMFSQSVSGLDLSSTYYYRCFASNAFGSTWAPGTADFMSGAQSYNWTGSSGNGYWNDPDNWEPDTGFPNSARETAVFTHTPSTPATTVMLNQSSITVGGIVMTPGNDVSEVFKINANGPSQVLIFDNASEPGFIHVNGSTYGGEIGAPVQLAGDTEVSTTTSGNKHALTFTGTLDGPGRLIAKSGRIGFDPVVDTEYDIDIIGTKNGGTIWKRGDKTAIFTGMNSVALSGDSQGPAFISEGGEFVVSGSSFSDSASDGGKLIFGSQGGNALVVTNGGVLNFSHVGGPYPKLLYQMSDNNVIVSGSGSKLDLKNNELHMNSNKGYLEITDGAQVYQIKMFLGWNTVKLRLILLGNFIRK